MASGGQVDGARGPRRAGIWVCAQREAGEREVRGRALGGSRSVIGRRLPVPADNQEVSEVALQWAADVTEIITYRS